MKWCADYNMHGGRMPLRDTGSEYLVAFTSEILLHKTKGISKKVKQLSPKEGMFQLHGDFGENVGVSQNCSS